MVNDLMYHAWVMWGRENPFEYTTAQGEDQKFQDYFGCGPFVAFESWNLLVLHDLLPESDNGTKGTMEQLLWALLFMKQYPKSKPLKKLCGGVDLKTICKWCFDFIEALAMLESEVVSEVY
jgi:hypothetical protein